MYGEYSRSIPDTIRGLRQRFPEENLTKFRVKHVFNLSEDTGSVREPKRVRNKRVTENF